MTGSELLDSSVWIAYFFEGCHKELIESGKIFLISTLSLFEIKKKMLERNISAKEINEKMRLVKNSTVSIEPTELISEFAAEISVKEKIPAVDSLIYTTAIKNDAILITRNNDFRRLKNVRVLDAS